MKIAFEEIHPDADSSFHILLTPHLQDVFLWHYHPEYEIVYIDGASGTRHVGDHISRYEGSDLVFIGPNIPHLNFDYGVRTEYRKVVVQLNESFLGEGFWKAPEFAQITALFERARAGLSFSGETKRAVGAQLEALASQPPFQRMMALLSIFQQMATSQEVDSLHGKPVTNAYNLREQQRLRRLYQFVEEEFSRKIDIPEAASVASLTEAAFCRYIRRMTGLTFTQFLNQYRINQAQKLLLADHTVTEAAEASGFESLSYFNKIFRRVTGENPLQFKKRHVA
ncbi:AraC family transcriptional regulator [Fibrivirga algicola]|uniref:AraC family transcriptional regulator n=1 Tax=Fibrivirga algicola TaxID=2950420 RepID=A0ABX0QIU8_9BACT|nr:AraC family transcriptional regulator [Fibrivirga algicola]NID12401.1 AraC family transcriptional regulator [Fibrivirga algicola]